MSREGKKLVHVHSSVPGKKPLASNLEVGELAVNNAAGSEFISLKNTDDEIVKFSSDGKMASVIEKKTVIPYKGEVVEPTEQDLLENKSQIVIGLNQVAAADTAAYDQVNGATDMHGDVINPSEDSGKTNGAGFAINMDKFAMIGANPSFSSVTTQKVVSEEKLFIGNNEELEDGVAMPEVSVYGSEVKLHAEDGKVGITAGDDINISGLGDGNFHVENNICIGSGNEVKISGAEKITIGVDCSGTKTNEVDIDGENIVIHRKPTQDLESETVEDALHELYDIIEGYSSDTNDFVTAGTVNQTNGNIILNVKNQNNVTVGGLESYVNSKIGGISSFFDGAEYDSSAKTINFLNGTNVVDSIDATAFIKDGMVDTVEVKDVVISGETVKCMVITFNTDADKEVINIPLSDIFDSSILDEFYTRNEVDTMLGEEFSFDAHSGESFSSITDVIRADELVTSAALNDLNSRLIDLDAEKLNISDYTPFDSDNYFTKGEMEEVFREFGSELNNRYTKSETDAAIEAATSGSPSSQVISQLRTDVNTVSGNVDIIEASLDNKLDVSAYTPTDLSNYYTKDETDAAIESATSGDFVSKSGDTISGDTKVIGKFDVVGDASVSGYTTFRNGGNASVVLAESGIGQLVVNGTNGHPSYTIHDNGGSTVHTYTSNNAQTKLEITPEEESIINVSGGNITVSSGDVIVSSGNINVSSGVTAEKFIMRMGRSDLALMADGSTKTLNSITNDVKDAIASSGNFVSKSGDTISGDTKVIGKFDVVGTTTVSGNTTFRNSGNAMIYIGKDGSDQFVAYGTNGHPSYTIHDVNGNTEHLYTANDGQAKLEVTPNDSNIINVSGGNITVSSGNVEVSSGSINVSSGVTAEKFIMRMGHGDWVLMADGSTKTLNSITADLASGVTSLDSEVTNHIENSSMHFTEGEKSLFSTLLEKNILATVPFKNNQLGNSVSKGGKYYYFLNNSGNEISLEDAESIAITPYLTSEGSPDIQGDEIKLPFNNWAILIVDPDSPDQSHPNYIVKDDKILSVDEMFINNSGNKEEGLYVSVILDSTIGANYYGEYTKYSWKIDAISSNMFVSKSGDTISGDTNVLGNFKVSGKTSVSGELGVGHWARQSNVIMSPERLGTDAAIGDTKNIFAIYDETGATNIDDSYVAPYLSVYEEKIGGATPTIGKVKINGVTGQTVLSVVGDVSVSGEVISNGTTLTSDARLKENIAKVSNDYAALAEGIEFKTFNFKSNPEVKKVGVIAQELQAAGLGDFVKEDKDGNLSVDYISMLCLKIAQLEKEIKELKERG